jgi:precorrin-2 methylase
MTYQAHTAAARANTLRSIPLIRHVDTVMAWSDQRVAEWNLAIAQQCVDQRTRHLASAYKMLGDANRAPRQLRRIWKGNAFRRINENRALLRVARIELVTAQSAMMAFAPVTTTV